MRQKNGRFGKGDHWREPQQFRDLEWLRENYTRLQRSTGDIARQFGVTDVAILFWLRRHKIARRTVAEARKIKRWGSFGSDNPMWNRKGELNPNWRGGLTPARQAFYASAEWRKACATVWKRDGARCRRCDHGRHDSPDLPLHVHHVVSFADADLRADTANLVLLCEVCHRFVHSRRNVHRELL